MKIRFPAAMQHTTYMLVWWGGLLPRAAKALKAFVFMNGSSTYDY
jgi:hypothetical protein